MPAIPACSLRQLTHHPRKWAFPAHLVAGRRVGGYKYISIQATPATDTSRIEVGGLSVSASSPDATFEVIGSPYSLLSVTLSPSQDLHTRRGTLVGFAGDPDGTVSSLRMLNPIRRAMVGMPFLYQKITSTSAANALISTRSPLTTFTILQLDGTTDWKLAQRKALLAWTGSTLSVKPSLNARLSLAYWGSSDVTGRGLLALAGQGQVYAIELAEGETYVVHPSNVLAYSASSPSPRPDPYRFKSNNIRLQIPLQLGNFFPSSKFVDTLKTSNTYKLLANALLRIRTWSRRTIWGDRLFLQFRGPTTLLIQSRAARVNDVLTPQDVNEIADAPAGTVKEAIGNAQKTQNANSSAAAVAPSKPQPKVSIASIGKDGKVSFESA
ncbi:Altered inheritance of mitochondria protein 24, mitochondrial [Exophiala xenobiotica]|uniref:Altered inheritance of mitochondria protein 24, mitochondrial n=1 Tax=Vermiconidia calcicola TaxID=1690605 RepID=A0AAV9Q5S1_9PEZI|nr:Altered inheritance of mitochondria protein 24, mitochondrial [Exophiala xenobiotica]KAK5533504.1 Altered inheritance of mitochondria protein 24, mitochondrial [Vermiconidia calcicola]KAK5537069.1 Altered inheritance of mitochondria protein 24, mitochondrial [Chaetothyriales sp. CCFEE 6169]KAK5190466.1 Altered inheritance of mitochondria protein 24, mitochondrial [Exophiala xenobiotica]KAK5203922.1 Altered inheritance of mitochondria protein 24, mitochondrial [Exophiala xenobiotica]